MTKKVKNQYQTTFSYRIESWELVLKKKVIVALSSIIAKYIAFIPVAKKAT